MRVLFVGNFHSGRIGTRSSAEELSDVLALRGVEAVRSSRIRLGVPKTVAMWTATVLRGRAYDAAIVDVYSGRAFRWAEVVGQELARRSKPYVLNLVGGELPTFAGEHPGRVRRLLSSATAVTAPSAFIQSSMAPYRDDITLLPSHGLHLDRYVFRRRSRCEPTLVWLRAFHRVYAPLVAVQTLEQLMEDEPDAKLIMVGPDKGDGTLEEVRSYAASRSLGLDDRLEIVGSVPKDDVPVQLARGDVFLNTTRAESLGVSMLEAMACGMCVISTDVGAVADLVLDGVEGSLVPVDDPTAMADAVRRVLKTDGLASRLSAAARAKAEAFAWPSIAERWLELLDRTVGGRA